jgi:Mycobacterial 4 TMS phage holin, superfamily IV
MIRLLVRALVIAASAAIGLLVANAILDDMSLTWQTFVLDVVIFAALQAILAPFIAKVAHRNAPALLGGVGLITTLIALIITHAVSDGGLRITGAATWLYAALIVWLVTMIATVLLPTLVVVKKVRRSKERRNAN